jgi:hypothetical protein
MGIIEVPEQLGGAGSTFFNAVLVVEELSHVDASCGVLVDVQNTLVNNASDPLGKRRSQIEVPEHALRTRSGPTRCPRRVRARMPSPSPAALRKKAITGCSTDRSSGSPTRPRQVSSSYSRTRTRMPGTRESPPSSSSAISRLPGRQERRQDRHPRLLDLRADLEECRVPKENVLGEVGKGYKIAIETLNEGRIGIGAQMIGVARGALEHAIAYEGAEAVRKADLRVPGGPVSDRPGCDRARGCAPHGLQRSAAQGRRAAVPPRGRDGQARTSRPRSASA